MSKNPITGDEIATKVVNDLYRDGFDRIFKQKQTEDAANEPVFTGSSFLEDADEDQQTHS